MSFHHPASRILLSIAILSCTFSAHAYSQFDGFYIGASVGGSFARAKQNINASVNLQLVNPDSTPAFSSTLPAQLNTDMAQSSWLGALFGGYGYSWQSFYLGGEVFVSGTNYHLKNAAQATLSQNVFDLILLSANVNSVTKTEINPIQYGLHLRPGLLLSPGTLLFGLVGVSFAQVTYNVNASAVATVTNNLIPQTFTFPASFNVSKKKHKAVLQLGGGIEQRFYRCWAIRADYIYTYYGKFNLSRIRNVPIDLPVGPSPGALTISSNSQVKVSDNAVTLGLVYYFNG